MPLDEALSTQQASRGPDPNIIMSDVSLDGGWSTRTFPHLLPANKLAVADNVVFYRDGLISKRPGNGLYGGGTGKVGTGSPILSMTRFYYGSPRAGHLIAQSGGSIYAGNDGTGAFTKISTGINAVSATVPAGFTQLYDPDNSTGFTTLFVTDGVHTPQMWNGTTWATVNVTAGFLPANVRTGQPITPRYCISWGLHMVYGGDPNDPGGIWISDAARPERFSGFGLIDSQGTPYYAYYPGGADSPMGSVTGLEVLGSNLIVFFTNGVVAVVNTGTYGAYQYLFNTLSATIGAPAPGSIVAFPTHIKFFGGDKFYATDAQSIVSLPDDIPTVYANTAQSTQPPEIKVRSTVVGVRRGRQYWAAYDPTGGGTNTRLVVFDDTANGGWQYGAPTGGAWARWPTGMSMQSAVECTGPGDTGQLFWGSAVDDTVYQHDVGTYDDAGNNISVEIRAKSFFLDKPLSNKVVLGYYVMTALTLKANAYTVSITPYVYFDALQVLGNQLQVVVQQAGALWGAVTWGQFTWQASSSVLQASPKAYLFGQNPRGLSVSPGLIESSQSELNIFGFALEVVVEGTPDA